MVERAIYQRVAEWDNEIRQMDVILQNPNSMETHQTSLLRHQRGVLMDSRTYLMDMKIMGDINIGPSDYML